MRVNKLVRVMLGLVDTVVLGLSVDVRERVVVVRVRPKAYATNRCGRCARRCPGHDRGPGVRRWRAPDVGQLRVFLEAAVPRVRCPQHRVVLARVPWARHGARHTRDFEDLAAWLARHTAKSTVAHVMRVSWRSVGAMVARVLADLDAAAGDRWDGIRRIGIDEISYKRGHNFLTVVVDHDTGRLLWMTPGRTKRALGLFFERLGPDRCARLELVSADGADWIAEVVALNAPQAKRCMDPFHVVKWGMDALDDTRRQVAGQARRHGDADLAKALGAGCRFALWKNPDHLTVKQQATLADIERINQPVFRAYILKEQLRAVFSHDGEDGRRRGRRGRRGPAGRVDRRRRPQRTARLRQARRQDRGLQPDDQKRPPVQAQQRPGGVHQHQDPAHHPGRVRVQVTPGPHRPGHAPPGWLRPPPARPNPGLTTHKISRRAPAGHDRPEWALGRRRGRCRGHLRTYRTIRLDPGIDALPPVVEPGTTSARSRGTSAAGTRHHFALITCSIGRARQTSRTVMRSSRPVCATKITSAVGAESMAANAPPDRGGSRFAMPRARRASSKRRFASSCRDAAPPPARREVATLREDDQRSGRTEA